jgi:hypothetical protein
LSVDRRVFVLPAGFPVVGLCLAIPWAVWVIRDFTWSGALLKTLLGWWDPQRIVPTGWEGCGKDS